MTIERAASKCCRADARRQRIANAACAPRGPSVQRMQLHRHKSPWGKQLHRKPLAICLAAADSGQQLEPRHPLFVSFAGGGIYFFWQLGCAKYLKEHYDLTKISMAGASSGALLACLLACGVDPQRQLNGAYQLAIDNDIWNRKFGLVGIWGGLIRSWLDDLLPDNAHEICSERLHIVIAKAPTLSLFEVDQFESKADLIEAVMASAHIPFFLDGKPFLRFRGRWAWDGSFPDFINFDNSENIKRDGKALIVDYALDKQLNFRRGDFIKLRPYDEILQLMDKGYAYMQRQHESGMVANMFDTEAAALSAP